MNQEPEQKPRLIHLTQAQVLELRRLTRAGVKPDLAVAKVAGLTLEELEKKSYRIVPPDK